MLRMKCCHMWIGLLLCTFSTAAISQNVSLTSKSFQTRGVGEFLGKILSVQIASTTAAGESGTVQLEVTQVLAGSLNSATITFPFQRSLAITDFLGNWDLIVPQTESLKKAVGDSVIIYFTGSAGSYSLYPAIDSVQKAQTGVLIATIESVHTERSILDWGGPSVDVELKVSETVYGWVNGTTVTLPYSSKPEISEIGPLGLGLLVAGVVPPGSLDQGFCDSNTGKQFVVSFSNGKIVSLIPASSSFLTALATADSQ